MSPISSNAHIDNFENSLKPEINLSTKSYTKNNNESPSSTASTITNTECDSSTMKKKKFNILENENIKIHKMENINYSQVLQLKVDKSPSFVLHNETAFTIDSKDSANSTVSNIKQFAFPENDMEDNININVIKDCLMNQRVPESCV